MFYCFHALYGTKLYNNSKKPPAAAGGQSAHERVVWAVTVDSRVLTWDESLSFLANVCCAEKAPTGAPVATGAL